MPTEAMTKRYTRRTSGSTVRAMMRSGGSMPTMRRPTGTTIAAMKRGGGSTSTAQRRTLSAQAQEKLKGTKFAVRPGPAAIRAQIQSKSLRMTPGTSGALAVKQTEGGYSYPEIPYQVEQGIPDYYRKSRAARGLPELPTEAGQLARKIGRFVANMPADPDNRGSIEATIAQVLIAAAQAAEQAGDSANAARLAEIAGLWAKRVVKAGGQAPTIDPDKPLSGVHFDYGFFHAPDGPVFSTGITSHHWAAMAAVGVGFVYGRESKSLVRGAVYGGIAYVLASGALSVFRRQD